MKSFWLVNKMRIGSGPRHSIGRQAEIGRR
jgi:hypothetical protein